MCMVCTYRSFVCRHNKPDGFIELSDKSAKKACILAKEADEPVFLVSPKDITHKKPEKTDDFCKVGTAAKIKEYLKLPNNKLRVVFDGLCRASLFSVTKRGDALFADTLCKKIVAENEGGLKGEALIRETVLAFDKFAKYIPNLSEDITLSVKTIKSMGFLADYIACNVFTAIEDKQAVLEEFDPFKRLELVNVILEKEIRIFSTELAVHKKVVARLESHQREHYLREQMKVIQNELGYSDGDNEIEEYLDAIQSKKLPEVISSKLIKEVYKLQKMPFGSAEASVIRNYIDVCLALPWGKKTRDRTDIARAKKILDQGIWEACKGISYGNITMFKKRKKYFFLKTKEDKIGLIFKRNVIGSDNYYKLLELLNKNISC